MTDKSVAFYLSPEHACSYIVGQMSTSLFIDPSVGVPYALVHRLTQNGYRRSGEIIYRPHCATCQACTPVRVRVAEFTCNRTRRRLLRYNADLSVTLEPVQFTREYYRLFRRYIRSQHRDGDMYPPSPRQFKDFLCVDTGFTRFWSFRKSGRLLAVAVVDHFEDSYSAVYSFYDPAEARRSLGVYSILCLIQEARKQKLPHLYLGYWIKNCRKMAYKSEFSPQEHYFEGQWQEMT